MKAALSSRFLKQTEDTTPLKSTVRPACAHRDQLPQEPSAREAFLKYLYCFNLIKNIYLNLEAVEGCPGLLCFGCKGCLRKQTRNSGSFSQLRLVVDTGVAPSFQNQISVRLF